MHQGKEESTCGARLRDRGATPLKRIAVYIMVSEGLYENKGYSTVAEPSIPAVETKCIPYILRTCHDSTLTPPAGVIAAVGPLHQNRVFPVDNLQAVHAHHHQTPAEHSLLSDSPGS
jgi:hypothetical protein